MRFAVFQNLRYALRQLKKSPGFTLTAILTMALGIGACTAIFSLFDQALLRSLPVKDPQNLVLLRHSGGDVGHVHEEGGDHKDAHPYFSYPMYRDLRDQGHAFDGLIATAASSAGVSWKNNSEVQPAEMVSGNYFNVLGVRPAIGRLFGNEDETAPGANPVAVLSFDYWKTRFHEDPAIVGQSVLVNGTPFTVVGVASPGFHSVVWGDIPRIFVPMTMQRVLEPNDDLMDRHYIWLKIIGRLPAAMPLKQVEASLDPVWRSLREMEFKSLHDQSARAHKDYVETSRLSLVNAAKGFSPLREDMEMPMKVLMGMVLLLTAMSAVNMASLLLVRAAGRVREISMRYALGARSGDIVRQLLTEGLVLGVAGGALGIACAPQLVRLLVRWISLTISDVPFAVGLNTGVLVFALGATLLVSVLFSLVPALQFLKPNLVGSLKQQASTGTGDSLKFRRTCVALQIGLSLLLLVAAGLFVRTIQNLRSVNPGFATDHLLTFGISPEMAGYSGASVTAIEQQAIERLSALPGVRGVAATNDPELAGDHVAGSMDIAGYTPKPNEDVDAEIPWVSQDYFQVMGIPLVAGRGFTQADAAGAQKVAVVNEMFARKYFGTPQNALGHHVSRSHRPVTDTMIVGVVRNAKHASVKDEMTPTVYRPFVQGEKPTELQFYVRTWQTPEATANAIRSAMQKMDSKLVISDLRTMENQMDETIAPQRFIGLLASLFGALAAVLAGVGLYGVLAYSTAQRTREIGIRMALGAQRGMIARQVLREVLALAAVSVLIALPVAYFLCRMMSSQLFGVSSADPIVYFGSIAMIGSVALLAAFLPARRAASVEPMQALRME
jgi:putative ABC transport system permease protein